VTAAGQLDGAKAPSLLFFFDPRSGQARRAEGFLAQVLQRRHNHETFLIHRIDVCERADLVDRLRILKLPTLLVVEDRLVRGRLEQPRGAAEIQTFLAPWLR
jgi:hypothetical protein